MSNSRFQAGSGVYTCKGCGKKTRETGNCESNCGLCLVCFEAAGFANSLSDEFGVSFDVSEARFKKCSTLREVEDAYDELKASHTCTSCGERGVDKEEIDSGLCYVCFEAGGYADSLNDDYNVPFSVTKPRFEKCSTIEEVEAAYAEMQAESLPGQALSQIERLDGYGLTITDPDLLRERLAEFQHDATEAATPLSTPFEAVTYKLPLVTTAGWSLDEGSRVSASDDIRVELVSADERVEVAFTSGHPITDPESGWVYGGVEVTVPAGTSRQDAHNLASRLLFDQHTTVPAYGPRFVVGECEGDQAEIHDNKENRLIGVFESLEVAEVVAEAMNAREEEARKRTGGEA